MIRAGMARRIRLVRLAAGLIRTWRSQERLWREGTEDTLAKRDRMLAEAGLAVRRAAEDLCGVVVKAGQFLATREDILPEAFTRALNPLQDQVPKAPSEAVRRSVEEALGRPLAEVFTAFAEEPVASASLAQVHRATLKDGERVAVKVLRPGIERMVQADLATLRAILAVAGRLPGVQSRLNLNGLYEVFSGALNRELDLVQEANHMRRFTERFSDDPRVVIPAVHRDLSSRRVLVMSWMEGADLRDSGQLRAWGIDPIHLRDTLITLYARQLLVEGFVHLDPHFGNLLALPDGRLALLDHGMAMRLGQDEVAALRQLIQSVMFGHRAGVMAALQTLGFVSSRSAADLFDSLWLALHEGGNRREAMRHALRNLVNHPSFRVQTKYMLLIRCLGILKTVIETLTPGEVRWTALLPERVAPVLWQSEEASRR